MNLCDYIRTENSKGNYTGMIMIDLQKAFDCVDHDLLLKKLSAMGVTSIDWFCSYLNDRSQCTNVAGVDSSFLSVACGVPQGSILGPTLFLCYINDMSSALRCKLSLYADDSALVFSGPNPITVADFLSAELDTCRKWLVDNRLSLHLGKTECILFGTRRRLARGVEFDVRLGDAPINRVTSVKYLGVTLDQYLDFSVHVDHIIKKASGKLSFLYRNHSFLDLFSCKLLCQTLIFSSLEYCATSWYSGLSCSLREALNVCQRKCVRFTLNFGPRDHVGNDEFCSLNWLPFPTRVKYFNGVYAFKVRSKLAPGYLAEQFTFISDIHSHNLRQSSSNFSLAFCNSPTGTFQRSAVSEWNALPMELKSIQSLPSFKLKLKQFLQLS